MNKRGTALAIALSFAIILSIAAGAVMTFARSHYGVLAEGADRIEKMHTAEAALWHAHWMLYNIRGGSNTPFRWGDNHSIDMPLMVGRYAADITFTYQALTDSYEIYIDTFRHAMAI